MLHQSDSTLPDAPGKIAELELSGPIFEGDDHGLLEQLFDRSRWRHYSAHAQIIHEGSAPGDVHFVLSGKVRIVGYSDSGREVAYGEIEPGGYFGELSALDGAPRSANAVALTETLTATLRGREFAAVVARHPGLALEVMRRLTAIVREADARIMSLSTLTAANRIRADLLRLACKSMVDARSAMIMPSPSHADIAARVGTSRETVSRILAGLRRKGLVQCRRGALRVPDVARLAELAEARRSAR